MTPGKLRRKLCLFFNKLETFMNTYVFLIYDLSLIYSFKSLSMHCSEILLLSTDEMHTCTILIIKNVGTIDYLLVYG